MLAIISDSGPRYLKSGNLDRHRWATNTDILHSDGEIYCLDTVVYSDGSSETIMPGNRFYWEPVEKEDAL